MKKLLFLSPELPYPAHSGGKLKSLQLLKHLTKHFTVTLACPLKLEDENHLRGFRSEIELRNVLCVPVARERSLANLAKSYLRGVPLNVYRSASGRLLDSLNDKQNVFDVVFVDHFEAAQYIPKDNRGRIIYHAHNTYHQTWSRFAEQEGFLPHRIAASLESYRVRAYETALCNRADLVFAAPNDIDSLRKAGAGWARFRETYHLGSESSLAAPDLMFEDTSESLLYVGYLGWEPNASGLIWFIQNVWPLLMVKYPKLTLKIVGKNPDQRLCELVNQFEAIELMGFVEDLEPCFLKSRINIAPLHFGSGMKVKVLDAMARGLPTVTTHVGVEGVSATNGVHVAVCDTAEVMATQIGRLIEDRNHWHTMSAASRELIRKKYSWEPLLRSMYEDIKRTLTLPYAARTGGEQKSLNLGQHAVS
ncbi:MAG: glycosyltransferase [Pseudomonadota bacterium]